MVSVELQGRLGNHLYQYVMARVISEKLDYDFTIPNGVPYGDKTVKGGWLGNKFFNCDMGIQPYRKQTNVFKEIGDKFNSEVFDIDNNTHLNGWWQSERYFEGFEGEIREWFKMDTPTNNIIDDNTCVIHFRAQDAYLRDYLLPKKYFISAKEHINSRINKDIKFIVITDNKPLAKKYFPYDTIYQNDMRTDFQLILHSKYKIISSSTFSWWASWLGLLNSEIVIAPDRWLNYNYNFTKDETFFPKDIKTKNFIYL
jgi:hypothetical protein